MAGSDILSQDELDALLAGVDVLEPEETAPAPAHSPPARAYDFTSQDRIVRGRMPTLEMINERLARGLRLGLAGLLRRSPEVAVEPVEMKKFGDYLLGLSAPCSVNLVKARPLRGTALVVFSAPLVEALVEGFFGGDARRARAGGAHEFTPTELRLAGRLLDCVLAALQKAWEPVERLALRQVGCESDPQLAQVLSPSEVVTVSGLRLAFAGGGGLLQVVMPYGMLEPVRELLAAGVQSDREDLDPGWSEALRAQLRQAAVRLDCSLTRTELTLRELLALRPGDILPVDIPESVCARVDGVPVLRARHSVSRGMRALEVLAPVAVSVEET